MKKLLLAALLVLPGCMTNPFEVGPGRTSLEITPDGKLKYVNSRGKIGKATGSVVLANGTRGNFSFSDIDGEGVQTAGMQGNAATLALILALLDKKVPNLGAILAGTGALPPPAPPPP